MQNPRPRNCKRRHIVQVITKKRSERYLPNLGICLKKGNLVFEEGNPVSKKGNPAFKKGNPAFKKGILVLACTGRKVGRLDSQACILGRCQALKCRCHHQMGAKVNAQRGLLHNSADRLCWSLLPRKWCQAVRLRPLLHTRRGPG